MSMGITKLMTSNPLNRLMFEWSQLKAGTSEYVQTAAMNGSVQSDNMRSFTLLCIDHFIESKYFTKTGKMTPKVEILHARVELSI